MDPHMIPILTALFKDLIITRITLLREMGQMGEKVFFNS